MHDPPRLLVIAAAEPSDSHGIGGPPVTVSAARKRFRADRERRLHGECAAAFSRRCATGLHGSRRDEQQAKSATA